VFRVGVMHRLGIVPQRLLREPLRIPTWLLVFKPNPFVKAGPPAEARLRAKI
jgi:hypothetical protein